MSQIFFAGAEKVETLRKLVELGVTHVLFSYYYIGQRGQLDLLFDLLDEYPQTRVFLDSGAFTFRMVNYSGKKQKRNPQEYFLDYRDFLRQHGHRFLYAVELDIDGTLGVSDDDITGWREDLAALGTVPIIPVWHENRGRAAWDDLCKDARYPHIGLGSFSLNMHQRTQYVNRAHGFGKTVHGFAETKILTTLKYIKYDTIDSTSWMAGSQYGMTYIFKGNRWIALEKHHKKDRRKYLRYFESIGCNPARILADNSDEVDKANIIAWRNLSQRFVVMHRSHVDEGILVRRRDGTIAYARERAVRTVPAKNEREPIRIIRPSAVSARQSISQVHGIDTEGQHRIGRELVEHTLPLQGIAPRRSLDEARQLVEGAPRLLRTFGLAGVIGLNEDARLEEVDGEGVSEEVGSSDI